MEHAASNGRIKVAPVRSAVVPEWAQKLRNAVIAELTEDDIRQVVRAIIDDAKRGSGSARNLLLNGLLGGKLPQLLLGDITEQRD